MFTERLACLHVLCETISVGMINLLFLLSLLIYRWTIVLIYLFQNCVILCSHITKAGRQGMVCLIPDTVEV